MNSSEKLHRRIETLQRGNKRLSDKAYRYKKRMDARLTMSESIDLKQKWARYDQLQGTVDELRKRIHRLQAALQDQRNMTEAKRQKIAKVESTIGLLENTIGIKKDQIEVRDKLMQEVVDEYHERMNVYYMGGKLEESSVIFKVKSFLEK